MELPIQVSGPDLKGREFLDRDRTIAVARHGRKIQLTEKLVPDQEIVVGSLELKREAPARIVGSLGDADSGYLYGVMFLDPGADVWGIEFATTSEGKNAVGRTVLERWRCHAREVTYLDGIELEVLEVNGCITRQCKHCTDTSVWKKSFAEALVPSAAGFPAQERRRELRRALKVRACVRSAEFGEDLVIIRNVSRSGLCFESTKSNRPGQDAEVALPYNPNGGNIFLAARVARVNRDSSGALVICGVAYRR